MAQNQNYARSDTGLVSLAPPGWARHYIGIPFKDQGHDFDGCNCWGLVYLVLKERTGIELNPHSDVSARDIAKATSAFAISSQDWIKIEAPQVYDVALLRGDPLHTGIVVAPGWLLHIWRAPASIVMRFDDPRIRARISGFFRHEQIANRSS